MSGCAVRFTTLIVGVPELVARVSVLLDGVPGLIIQFDADAGNVFVDTVAGTISPSSKEPAVKLPSSVTVAFVLSGRSRVLKLATASTAFGMPPTQLPAEFQVPPAFCVKFEAQMMCGLIN